MKHAFLLLFVAAATCCAPMASSCGWEKPLTFVEPPPGSYTAASFTLTIGNASTKVAGAAVDPVFFNVTGLTPMLGRLFANGDAAAEGSMVVILGHPLWLSRFGGDPSIIGRELDIDGRRTIVVGIMPKGFAFPDGAQMWVPKR